MTPVELRSRIARGEWITPTAGVLDDYQQANLVIVPQAHAYALLLFCLRNPRACPILAVGDAGDPWVPLPGAAIDIRTMLPRYRVWQQGRLVAEPTDIEAYWRDDAVAILLGCSHTFDAPLRRAGVPVSPEAPPVYTTNRPNIAAGPLAGTLAVSMRPVPRELVSQAVLVTARYPSGHGAPVHIGDPLALGIGDLQSPDFGVVPPLGEDDVPVFWACGVTPQQVLPQLGAVYCIAHYPGHMLVLDQRPEAFG
ncbi:DUF1445 domain-containing protein [Pseudomonas sp. 102515]|uniref:D-glutamate cyclase family protein n=1 Tax=Pseudomonas sp. 102515 TaxID=3071568 RepID=UPI0028026567|nr:DUF1445 domain-containing protein [Pseudomonas sp. 102515]MDQ7915700.1 DUF1445 domain-containing protein [Pseudomonas sp. 102515]